MQLEFMLIEVAGIEGDHARLLGAGSKAVG
jgi:hypothetical protein